MLDTLHSERFVDQSPAEVHATARGADLPGRASAICLAIGRVSSSGIGPCAIRSARVGPSTTGAANFSISDNGRLVYVPGSPGGSDIVTLVWVDRDGNEKGVPAEPRAYGHPRVSPDGTRVAVDIADGDNTDVWIWDLERETLTQFIFDGGMDEFPLWTPDSSRVVFSSSRDCGGLFWKSADGTGQVERLKDGAVRPSGWATNGRLIFDDADQLEDIGMLTIEGERTVEMLFDAEFDEGSPELSPDGRWLAYVSDETEAELIYVHPFPNIDDGLWRVSPDSGNNPVWSPDGSELFYRNAEGINRNAEGINLMVAQVEAEPTFRARTSEPLFSIRGYRFGGGRQYDIAPDGQRFLFIKDNTGQVAGQSQINVVLNWFQELTERVPVN